MCPLLLNSLTHARIQTKWFFLQQLNCSENKRQFACSSCSFMHFKYFEMYEQNCEKNFFIWNSNFILQFGVFASSSSAMRYSTKHIIRLYFIFFSISWMIAIYFPVTFLEEEQKWKAFFRLVEMQAIQLKPFKTTILDDLTSYSPPNAFDHDELEHSIWNWFVGHSTLNKEQKFSVEFFLLLAWFYLQLSLYWNDETLFLKSNIFSETIAFYIELKCNFSNGRKNLNHFSKRWLDFVVAVVAKF